MTSKSYKILYHHRTLALDGQNVHITEMLKAFRAAGHEVHVVCPAPQDKGGQEKASLFNKIRGLVPAFIYELAEIAYSYRAYKKLLKAHEEFQPDFIYERYNCFTLSGKWLREKTKTPLIMEVNAPLADERRRHGTLALYGTAKKLEAEIWQSADKIITVSDVLSGLVAETGVSKDKIVSMHNGIDPDKFDNIDTDTGQMVQWYNLFGKTILGFTGYIRDWHKLDDVIRLIATEKENHNLHLMAVGDGPAVADCLILAKDLGIEDRVTFTGVVAREKVADYVNCFDIALQPAVTEYASPLKIFEYLALSKPIIAPRQANIEEILTHGVDSILFDTRDHAGLHDAIMHYVEDPKSRQKAAKAARQTLEDRSFYWSTNAKRTIELASPLVRRSD
ncbi:glycosyltransferase family 4 protein [Temperatibacter marinus]|uniref:Glycosyltransferase family 4 protein n=1 Tax=Temperatibacter marinus TaxID=1456591 RepID=A0AA52H8Q4_9PROT|nr:glycosyltransferase family 4 protein [Temperatibacter marinus]WND01702.1 glycosyltransferase family 4 protein [Temperatibacter marinus]